MLHGSGARESRDMHAKGNVDRRGYLRVTNDGLFLHIKQNNVAIAGQATGFLKDEIFKTIQANTLLAGKHVSAAIQLAADGAAYEYSITIHPGTFYNDYPVRVEQIFGERWTLAPDPGSPDALRMTEAIRMAWLEHQRDIAQVAAATHIHARSRR